MIVDASVAFKWLIHEADSDEAIAWIGSGQRLVAPNLIIAEVGHALTKRIRRGELDSDGASANFARLPWLLELIDDTAFATRAFDLSVTLRHSFYDCIYLAAAEASGDKLLTADAVLAEKLSDHSLGALIMVLGQHE